MHRGLSRHRQPHETFGALERKSVEAIEQHMAEQRLSLKVTLVGRDRQPTRSLTRIARHDAVGTIEIEACQIILRVGIAEIQRRILKHFQCPLRVGLDVGFRDAVEAVDADRHKGVGNDGQVATIAVLLVVVLDDL